MNLVRTFSVSVSLVAFLMLATPVDAQEENGGLTEDQIDAVITMLQSFEVASSTIATVEATLKGEDVVHDDEDEEADQHDDEEEGDDDDTQGPPHGVGPGSLPEQASDRAHHVQTCVQVGRILRQGSSGDEVQQLQEFLKERGYFDHETATGYYGSITEAAVQRFQEAEGIVNEGDPQTTGFGQVGPRTQAALAQTSCLRDEGPMEEDGDEESEDNEEENGDDNGADGDENGVNGDEDDDEDEDDNDDENGDEDDDEDGDSDNDDDENGDEE